MLLKDILNINEGLKSISIQKMDIDLSYDILKFSKLIAEEIKIYDEARKKLIEDYALKDENGNFLVEDEQYVFGKNQIKFNNDFNQLLEKEIDIKSIKIKRENLKDNKIKLSPLDLINLEKIIEG